MHLRNQGRAFDGSYTPAQIKSVMKYLNPSNYGVIWLDESTEFTHVEENDSNFLINQYHILFLHSI